MTRKKVANRPEVVTIELLTALEVANFLHRPGKAVHTQTVLNWANSGRLPDIARLRRFDRKTVEAFAAKPYTVGNQVMTTKEVAGFLSQKPSTIVRWANKGRLPEIENTSAGVRLFDRKGVEAFAVKRYSFSPDIMNTWEVAEYLDRDCQTILKWTQQGKLRAIAGTSEPRKARLYQREAVEVFAGLKPRIMTAKQVAILLNVHDQTILEWVNTGKLSDMPEHRRFDKEVVEMFTWRKSECMGLWEVAIEFGESISTIRSWADKGKLPRPEPTPGECKLFNRKAVMATFNQDKSLGREEMDT